jgi:hypothetical protein
MCLFALSVRAEPAGVPPPTPPIPVTPGIPPTPAIPSKPAASPETAGGAKVPIDVIEKRLPEQVFGMKRLKMERSAAGKGVVLQALYQGQVGRATLLVDARNEAAIADGVSAPEVDAAVKAAVARDAKEKVTALGERYWQSEPFMKRLDEKRTGVTVLCGMIERRAGTEAKAPEQIRMRSAACATGAGGRLMTVRVATPYMGALEADAQKAQEYFVVALAQSVAGKVRAEPR